MPFADYIRAILAQEAKAAGRTPPSDDEITAVIERLEESGYSRTSLPEKPSEITHNLRAYGIIYNTYTSTASP